MITGCVVKFQPVYLLNRQHSDAARALGGEAPAHLAMALQQQGAIGRRQPPAQIVRFVNSEAFHLVGGLDDRPVGECRHETKAPRVPGPKFVRHRRSKTCWFFCHHWYRNFQEHIFAGPKGDCFAVTYKLWPWDTWRLYFLTAFSDGALVETANQMERFRIDEPDYLRWGLETPDRALLLERHREVCRTFAAAGSRSDSPAVFVDQAGALCRTFAAGGSRSVAVLPVEQVNRLERRHASRYHRKHHRWAGLIVMSFSLCCLGIAMLPVFWFGGTAPYLLPVSVIAWGFLWPALLACLLRSTATRRQRNQQTPRPLDAGAL
jgi:hypothetical protein